MTPADLVSMLAGGLAAVLPWIGAGVGGGIALLLVFMGISKAFAFFMSLTGDGAGNSDMVAFYASRDSARRDDDSW